MLEYAPNYRSHPGLDFLISNTGIFLAHHKGFKIPGDGLFIQQIFLSRNQVPGSQSSVGTKIYTDG